MQLKSYLEIKIEVTFLRASPVGWLVDLLSTQLIRIQFFGTSRTSPQESPCPIVNSLPLTGPKKGLVNVWHKLARTTYVHDDATTFANVK